MCQWQCGAGVRLSSQISGVGNGRTLGGGRADGGQVLSHTLSRADQLSRLRGSCPCDVTARARSVIAMPAHMRKDEDARDG